MATTTLQSRTRDPRAALERAVTATAARRRADVEVLEAALEWAHAHTVRPGDRAAGWRSETIHAPGSVAALFGEQAVPLAGPGTPLVAEFAPVELSAAMDISHEAALALLGDVLDLAHRLPRLWRLVQDLRIPVHLGRRAAQESRDLTADAADHADRLLAWQPRRLNPHRVGVLVHEARLYADPDRAIADHDAALDARRVEVHHGLRAPTTSSVFMELDLADGVAFDRTVSQGAATMAALGHPGSLGVRRAHVVGLLADPQKALDLLSVDPADPARPDPETDPATCVAEEAAYARPDPFAGPTRGAGGSGSGAADAVIVLHVTDRDLLHPDRAGKHGVARSDTLGPVVLDRLSGWLAGAGKVIIKPVLDPTAIAAVDAHDPPARMVEAVRLRDETCVFPRCGRSSQRCDLDHITAYVPLDDGGPPGQTSYDALAPLCRRHHRAKTFSHFTYRRLPDGSYEWTLPTGTHVTTDPAAPRPGPGPDARSRSSERHRRRPVPPC